MYSQNRRIKATSPKSTVYFDLLDTIPEDREMRPEEFWHFGTEGYKNYLFEKYNSFGSYNKIQRKILSQQGAHNRDLKNWDSSSCIPGKPKEEGLIEFLARHKCEY